MLSKNHYHIIMNILNQNDLQTINKFSTLSVRCSVDTSRRTEPQTMCCNVTLYTIRTYNIISRRDGGAGMRRGAAGGGAALMDALYLCRLQVLPSIFRRRHLGARAAPRSNIAETAGLAFATD